MKTQTAHKLAVAILLLAAFVLPFLLKHAVLNSPTNRAYLGAFVSGSKTQAPAQASDIQNSQASLWAQNIGSNYTRP